MYIKISKENKEQMINKIQEYYFRERSEEISHLAADILLDFIKKDLGPYFYNQGIQDASKLVEQKMMSIEEDLQSLARPLR